MENTLAKYISVFFHPLFIPVYGMLILLNSNAYFALVLPGRLVWLLFAFTIITSVLLPLLSALLFKRTAIISSLYMPHHKERVFPFITMALYYLTASYSLFNIEQLPVIYATFFFTTGILVLVASVISFFWKISIHLIAIGGITGLFLALTLTDNYIAPYFFIGSIWIAGLVGSSRLLLKSHNSKQIYAGFFLGFLFMLFVFL